MNANDAMLTLSQLGWEWHNRGVIIWVTIGGRQYSVWVPVSRLVLTFGDELAAGGAPLPTTVGACQTVGGFFGSIKRAWRKAKKKVRKAIPKSLKRAARKVGRFAKAAARKGLKALRFAKRIVQSREAQLIVAGISAAVPALAPAGAALIAAQEALRHIDDGVEVAKKVTQGAKVTKRMADKMLRANKERKKLERIASQAKAGSRQAQELMGAVKQLSGT